MASNKRRTPHIATSATTLLLERPNPKTFGSRLDWSTYVINLELEGGEPRGQIWTFCKGFGRDISCFLPHDFYREISHCFSWTRIMPVNPSIPWRKFQYAEGRYQWNSARYRSKTTGCNVGDVKREYCSIHINVSSWTRKFEKYLQNKSHVKEPIIFNWVLARIFI